MNMELLDEYKIIEWVQNYWMNIKFLNEYRIIKQKLVDLVRYISILNINKN